MRGKSALPAYEARARVRAGDGKCGTRPPLDSKPLSLTQSGCSAPALTASLDSAFAYYNAIQMEEVLTLRLPKGSRRRLTQLAKRKRQNLSQYVRQAIEAQLWIDALDETVVLAAPKATAIGVKTDDDVFRLFS